MEKYGEVPKRFTKKWWEHFREYYKWHVIITAVAVLVAVVTIVQCANRVQYDCIVIYAGHMHFGDNAIETMNEIASEYASDVDGNGSIHTHFVPLEFTYIDGREDYDAAVQQKLDLTFLDDCTFLYIMEDEVAERYAGRKDTPDAFEGAEVFAADTDENILYDINGRGFAVSLKDSKILKERNINSENLYALIRRDNRGGDKNAAAYEDAVKMARALIQ